MLKVPAIAKGEKYIIDGIWLAIDILKGFEITKLKIKTHLVQVEVVRLQRGA